MDASITKRIKDWLSRVCYAEDDDSDKGDLKKIVIHRVTVSEKIGMEINDVKVSHKPDAATLKEWVETLCEALSTDSEGSGSAQKYVLVAMYKGEGWSKGQKLTVRVAPDEREDEEMSSEPPTKEGVTKALMKHTEIFARIAVGTAERSLIALGRELENVRGQNEKLLDKNFELTVLMEELLSKRHERDLASKVADHKIDRQGEIFHKLMMLAPIVINKFTMAKSGQKLLPEKTTALEQAFHSFLISIKPGQFEGLLANLDEDQRMMLQTLFVDMAKFDPPKASGGANGAA